MAELAQKRPESDKYQRIIEAATRVFADKGFFKATVSDVAGAAEVAEGTIYLYFKNKDDLLISIFENSMDMFARELDQALSGVTDPAERLRCLIHLHLRLVEEHKELAQVLHVELRQSEKFMREYQGEKVINYLKKIQGIVLEGQEQGVFRKDLDARVIRRSIFGSLDEVALKWVLTKKKEPLEQRATQLADLFLHGLVATNDCHPEQSEGSHGSREILRR